MNNNLKGKKCEFIINFLYIVILLLIITFSFKYAINIFFPFILAFAISYIINPAVQVISKKLNINRSISTVFTLLLLIIVLILITAALSLTVFDGLKLIYSNLPKYAEQVSEYFETINSKTSNNNDSFLDSLLFQVYNYMKNIKISEIIGGSFGGRILNYISNIVTSLPQIIISVIITIVSIIFISSSFEGIKHFIIIQIPEKQKNMFFQIKKNIFSILKKYFKSYVTLMLITFIELTVLFLVFKIEPSASLAFVISFVDVLPVLGIGTVMIPWAVFLFITGNITSGSVIIAIYILVTVVRQIIEPKILGKTIGLHPIVTLICIYVGLKLFGIIGVILLPITMIILKDLQSKGYIKIWKEKA